MIFYIIYKEDNSYVQLAYWALLVSIGYSCQTWILKKQQGSLSSKQNGLLIISIIALLLSVPFLAFTYFVRYKSTCYGGNGQQCYSLARQRNREIDFSVLVGIIYKNPTVYYLESACRNEVYEACVDLIREFGNDIDIEQIRSAYKFASTYNKADLFHFSKFELRQKNTAVAETIAKESCEIAKDNQGCMLWGSLLVEKGEKPKGINVLKLACNSNSVDACNLLYAFYKENGTTEESALYLKRLCSLGNSKACEMLEGNEALPH